MSNLSWVPTWDRASTGPLAAAMTALLRGDGDGTPPPGALLAVSRGEQVCFALDGDAQRLPGRSPVAMQLDARTDAGSLTKILATTAALAGLVDRGEMTIDAPVRRFLPELSDPETTVADLLEHRAGLWEWWPLYVDGSREAAALAHLVRLPRRYPRGSGRHYSDLGFILLGELVSRVAGCGTDEAMTRLALDPFGLQDTRYRAPAPGAPVLASSTGDGIEQAMIDTGVPYPVTGNSAQFPRWRSHVLVGEVNDGNAFHAFGGVAGHAGLFTTAADLIRFGRGMLASLAGAGPLTARTARRFVTAGADPGQALGFRVWPDPHCPAMGHTGFPGVGFALFPEQDAVAVMITNRLHVAGEARPGEQLWQTALTAVRQLLGARTGERR
jgi:serine-type D-Ala-D-Ala carboxypeptidase